MTTKVHACVDALGNPIRLILTGGQVADITQGAALVEAIPTEAIIADKPKDEKAAGEGTAVKPESAQGERPAADQPATAPTP